MAPDQAFESHRRLLFGIAYRMLGSAAEAEDVVQDAWLRWRGAPNRVESAKAWLSTVVTRLCLDRLRSARAQREAYVGPWLPEPIRTEGAAEAESISLAFLLLLQSLTPLERAVYLLREVFDYSHAEVAAAIDRDEAACRQLHHRAREHMKARSPRFAPSPEDHRRLLGGFAQAISTGDLDGLTRLLAHDVTLYTDGGGKTRAARNPIHGADPVARFFVGIMRKQPSGPDQTYELAEVNGWQALVGRVGGQVNLVLCIETDGVHIRGVHSILNPDKLRRL